MLDLKTSDEHLARVAKESISKVFKISFFMAFFFFCAPFVSYLIFKNKQAFEVNFPQLLHIYGYSFAIFMPLALTYVVVPIYTFRWFLLLVGGCISLYYMFKETREIMVKYFDETA